MWSSLIAKVAFFATLVLSCVSSAAPPAFLPSAPPFAPNSSVLFTGRWFVGHLCQAPLPGTWSPTPQELIGADRALADVLSGAGVSQEDVTRMVLGMGSAMDDLQPASAYYRQFGAAVTPSGRRIICINAIHQDADEVIENGEWRRWPVYFIDGGWIQIRAIYEPAKRSIIYFEPNGVA